MATKKPTTKAGKTRTVRKTNQKGSTHTHKVKELTSPAKRDLKNAIVDFKTTMAHRMVGRPRNFDTPEEMLAAVIEYFDQCEEGNIPLTINGLVTKLGFQSRQSLYDVEGYSPEFSYIVQNARKFIERGYETLLFSGNALGAKFALQNSADPWQDKQTREMTGKVGIEAVRELTPLQRAARMDSLLAKAAKRKEEQEAIEGEIADDGDSGAETEPS